MKNLTEEVIKALNEIQSLVQDFHQVLSVNHSDSKGVSIIEEYRNGTLNEDDVKHLDVLIWLGMQGHDVLRWMVMVGDIDDKDVEDCDNVVNLARLQEVRIEGYQGVKDDNNR